MRLETVVIITKGFCFMLIGGLTPLATGLTQWLVDGKWPPAINWVCILAGCGVGAATQILAFLSQSFGDWKISTGHPANVIAPATADPASVAALTVAVENNSAAIKTATGVYPQKV